MLLHKKEENVRVICYVSRSLLPVERHYFETEKEALALVFALKKLKMYFLGRKFYHITDHKPLQPRV